MKFCRVFLGVVFVGVMPFVLTACSTTCKSVDVCDRGKAAYPQMTDEQIVTMTNDLNGLANKAAR